MSASSSFISNIAMHFNYLTLCLFTILACFVDQTVALQAIFGGEVPTNFKPYHYMVSLLEINYGHICGGAIIGDQFILSAAHCFIYSDNTFKSKRVFALMGTSNLLRTTFPAITLEVVKVYVPVDFKASDINTTGDIAVLKLERPVNMTYHGLKRVFLERNRKKNYSAEKAKIAGWGWNKIESYRNQQTVYRSDSLLRYATVDIFNHPQCQLEYPKLRIAEEHLCARVEQHEHEHQIDGVCYGDDGGPLVYNGFVIGILSKFPKECTERNSSAIYTRVSHYLTFIKNVKMNYITKNIRAVVLRP